MQNLTLVILYKAHIEMRYGTKFNHSMYAYNGMVFVASNCVVRLFSKFDLEWHH